MTAATTTATGGVNTVRRVITYLLLGVMVLIAGIGLAGLLDRAFTTPDVLAEFGSYGLAQSLAFTFIAGPFAGALWWFAWRNLTDASGDRHSIAWPVYLVIAHTVSLIVFTVSLFDVLAGLVVGTWRPGQLAVAITWGLIWVWHHWMWHHATSGPTRLVSVAPALGSLWGLALFAGGLTATLTTVFDIALSSFGAGLGMPWWMHALSNLVWAVGGALTWWWHWTMRGVRTVSHGFSGVALVFIAGIWSVAMVLVGATLTLWHVLMLLFDARADLGLPFSELGFAVASALVGAVLWAYHRPFISTGNLREATRLATSGVALAVTATGVGVLVNTILAALSAPLVGSSLTSLLFSGLAALVVGAPIWWWVWQPTRVPAYGRGGRRAYLVAVFGASALVALITLLVIGFRLFEFFLDTVTGESLIDRIRVPLGLLVATALVAWHHFAVWRGDRAALGSSAPEVPRLRHVTLITGAPDAAAFVDAIRSATGASTTVLRSVATAADGAGAPSAAAVVAALADVAAQRVVVLAGPGSRLEVVQLEG